MTIPSSRQASEVYPGHAVLSSYDLVAINPGDAETLRAVTSSGLADVISLDLTSGRLPFPLRSELVASVLASGAVFEVDYSPAIRDASLRRFFGANLASLLRLTRGKGILLSSGAKTALELRNPHDAAAIASALGGLSPDRALLAMGKTVAHVLSRAEMRHAKGRGGSGSAVVTLPQVAKAGSGAGDASVVGPAASPVASSRQGKPPLLAGPASRGVAIALSLPKR